MSQDLLRIIDGICRDKSIDREEFIRDLEGAIESAVKKRFEVEEAEVHLDPLSGSISASVKGNPIDMQTLGRIAAQTAKQVIIQRTRERERTSILEEFSERQGQIVTGTVVREERGNLLVNIGRTEGFLPRSEQIPGETHMVGERIRVLILEVRELPNQVKVILSRSHPDFIVRLFELEVPEVAERIIEIKALAREAGYRTKVAVSSIDSKVDAVGACVGVRGSRIKNIVEELGGEKIDIVRFNESSQILIQNALKPAEVDEIALCLELGKATVVVPEDQLSLAIGKRGQNVRLAARLTGWDIDILKPSEHNKNLETMERVLRQIEGVDDLILDRIVALGAVSVYDVDDIGPEALVEPLEISEELANKICEEAGEEVIRIEEEKEAAAKADAEAAKAAAAAGPAETTTDNQSPSDTAFVADETAAEQSETPTAETAPEPPSNSAQEAPAAEPADAESTSETPAQPDEALTDQQAPQPEPTDTVDSKSEDNTETATP